MTATKFFHQSFAPWTGSRALEARIYCRACGKSKVVTGYTYEAWRAKHIGQIEDTNCDHCGTRLKYKIREDGIESL